MMMHDDEPLIKEAEFYRECLYWLLIGLEVEHIPVFMKRLSPLNCQKLGVAICRAIREKMNETR